MGKCKMWVKIKTDHIIKGNIESIQQDSLS